MAQAFLGLGSNIGDRLVNLQQAVNALTLLCDTTVTAASAVYETPPWGYIKQDPFYNAVVKVETALSPRALLGACLGIEAGMGRVRTKKNRPRIIDIDLLLYEGTKIQDAELTVPHPRMDERAFVLLPLLDIYKDRYYKNLCKDLQKEDIRKIPGSLFY